MTVSKRNTLKAIGAGIAAAACFPRGFAAQPARPVLIGALTASWGPTPAIAGLRAGLKELGYREDRDFVLGVRFTQGNSAELPAAARGLVKSGADIIVTSSGGNAANAAQLATSKIPIVFLGESDPVGRKLVASLPRPGGNITGVSNLEIELSPKKLEIFRELVPTLKRIVVVYDATNNEALERLAVDRNSARRAGLTLVERAVRSEDEASAAIAGVQKNEADGFYCSRLLALNIPGLVLDHSIKRSIAAMFDESYFVERGALASYSANSQEIGRQGARLVGKILKGAKPADIPVEQPTKFELVVNQKTARTLGIKIPASILLRADKVIE
jgi:putative tryptophan/tyrosine transport system substrate-binding protein